MKKLRNQPCPCGSGLKYKHCHGNLLKQQMCQHVAEEAMKKLIFQEQINKGLRCIHGVLKKEHCPSCKVGDNKPIIV